ncbi:MAG: hypothetical protein ACLPX9_13600 [Rhodomicrobium sp.]
MAYAYAAVLNTDLTDASAPMRPRGSWFDIWLDTMSLGLEAASVIGLRVLTIAAGGTAGLAEAQTMISEKIEASLTLQAKAVAGGLGITLFSAATGTLDHYRPKVLANRSRLLG